MAKKKPDEAPVKRSRGRPAGRTQDKQFLMRVSDGFFQTVDDWRDQQPDKPARAEAVKRMVDIAAKGK